MHEAVKFHKSDPIQIKKIILFHPHLNYHPPTKSKYLLKKKKKKKKKNKPEKNKSLVQKDVINKNLKFHTSDGSSNVPSSSTLKSEETLESTPKYTRIRPSPINTKRTSPYPVVSRKKFRKKLSSVNDS